MIPSPDGIKMSEIFMEYISPFCLSWDDRETADRLLTMGMIGWNAAMLSEADREEFLQKTLIRLPDDVRTEFRFHLNPLIQRKLRHFDTYKRFIVSYDLRVSQSGVNISVLSAIEKP